MSNLLNETISFLAHYNKTLDDVLMFCGDDFQFTRDEFIQLADVEYDEGFGRQWVAFDLKLVGTTWWIERQEYDGAEKWSMKVLPNYTKPFKSIHTLVSSWEDMGWDSLAMLNKEDDNID